MKKLFLFLTFLLVRDCLASSSLRLQIERGFFRETFSTSWTRAVESLLDGGAFTWSGRGSFEWRGLFIEGFLVRGKGRVTDYDWWISTLWFISEADFSLEGGGVRLGYRRGFLGFFLEREDLLWRIGPKAQNLLVDFKIPSLEEIHFEVNSLFLKSHLLVGVEARWKVFKGEVGILSQTNSGWWNLREMYFWWPSCGFFLALSLSKRVSLFSFALKVSFKETFGSFREEVAPYITRCKTSSLRISGLLTLTFEK